MTSPAANGSTPPIELRGVVKAFGRERVLDGVDLTVPANAITVLVGPSGAGKTVTIKHALGLMRPTSGFVLVRGHNLALAGDDELNDVRRSMAAVLQGTLPFSCGLFFSLSVYENVAFPLRERNRWPEQRIDEAVRENLELVGLGDCAELMPDQLSSGMAKRVAIARALALSSEIVIVDDFDSGLDGVRLALLCDLLRDAQRRTGAAYLITTHDMRAARQLADRIAVLYEGRVVASGTAEEVLASDEPVARQLITGGASGPIGLRDA